MDLYHRFKAILDSLPSQQMNEAQTREWILVPTMEQILGYATTEKVPEDTGMAGNRPDYTIMPQTPHTWLLEAKAWSVPLSDQHAIQATTYAYQNGIKWVVLTNGKEWQLYDSHVTGHDVRERLALCATKDDPEAMETMLRALSRESVVSGKVHEEVQARALALRLRSDVQDPSSECIKALRNALRKLPRLEQVTNEQIVDALKRMHAGSSHLPTPTDCVADQDSGQTGVPPAVSPPSGPSAIYLPLTAIGVPTGKSIAAVRLPSGTEVPIKTWCMLWRTVVTTLLETNNVPVPWPETSSGTRWRLNWEPRYSDGRPMRQPLAISDRGRDLYVETHASAAYLVELCVRLCRDVGAEPAAFRVRLAE